MNGGINLVSIFLTNGLALILDFILLLGNTNKFKNNSRDYQLTKRLLVLTIISCIVDPICFAADGKPGTGCFLAVFIGNSWLYLGNMLLGPTWTYLVINHLLGKIPRSQKVILWITVTLGLGALILNMFVPVVFSVDENNVYHREPLYWLYTFIEIFYLLNGLVIYVWVRSKGGVFKFFPVLQFIIPIIIGITAQVLYYGISVIWPSVVVSMAGLLTSLQNESLYMDSLTGLYNRLYLESIKKEVEKKQIGKVAVMMIDMNDFKYINDKFGHAEGDEALIQVARILKETVGSLGSAIRYAGDEFIILLNTSHEDIARGCALSIHKNIDEYNETVGKDYKLSVAIGSCIFDMTHSTIDTVLGEVDKLMYEEKAEYYKENKRLGSRAF